MVLVVVLYQSWLHQKNKLLHRTHPGNHILFTRSNQDLLLRVLLLLHHLHQRSEPDESQCHWNLCYRLPGNCSKGETPSSPHILPLNLWKLGHLGFLSLWFRADDSFNLLQEELNSIAGRWRRIGALKGAKHNQEPGPRYNQEPARHHQGPRYNQQRTHSQGPRHEAAKEVGMWSRALTNNLKTEHKFKDEGHSQAQAHGQTVKFTFLGQNLTTANPRDDMIGPKTKCYIISSETVRVRDIVVVD